LDAYLASKCPKKIREAIFRTADWRTTSEISFPILKLKREAKVQMMLNKSELPELEGFPDVDIVQEEKEKVVESLPSQPAVSLPPASSPPTATARPSALPPPPAAAGEPTSTDRLPKQKPSTPPTVSTITSDEVAHDKNPSVEGGDGDDTSDVDESQVHSDVTDTFDLQELPLRAAKPDGTYCTATHTIHVGHLTRDVPAPPQREKIKDFVIFISQSKKWSMITADKDNKDPASLM
jgi:hypothetical protein